MGVTDTVKIIIESEDQTSSGVGSAVGNIKKIGTVAIAAGGAVVAGIGAGVVAVGSQVFNMSNDTQNAMLDMRSEFGLTGDEAVRMANLARDAWANNWGESIPQVANTIGLVNQQLGEFGVVSDEALTNAATDAIALSDTFGIDTADSINAARTLMDKFGLTSDEAFDLVTTGMQNGLNRSGDFLDSIQEYGPVFQAAGFSAEEMYAIMESGAESGVLGTDKIADAVKEMTIRLNEGGDEVEGAFDTIGLNFDQIAASVASGDESWADYFDSIVSGLADIEDPIERNNAAVAIFGTMAEDLGPQFVESLSAAGVSLDDMEGATDSLNAKYESLGQVFEAGKRKIMGALAPIGDQLLGLANHAMPMVQDFIDTYLAPALEGFASAVETLAPHLETLFNILIGGETSLGSSVELMSALSSVFGTEMAVSIMEVVSGIRDFLTSISETAAPILETITQFVSWKDVLMALGIAIGTVIVPVILSLVGTILSVMAPIVAVVAIVALLRNAWENNFLGIQEKTRAVIQFVQNIITKVMTGVRTFWAQNGDQILAKARQIWNTIMSVISTVINTVRSIIVAVTNAIRAAWDEYGEGIKASAINFWTAIKGFIEGVINTIKNIITTVANAIKAFWDRHGEQIRAGAERAWEKIKQIIDNSMASIKTLFDTFASLFKGDWEGFLDGIKELWQSSWDNIELAIEAFKEFINPFIEGLVSDMKEKIQEALASLEGKFEGVFSAIQDAIQPALDLWTDFKSAVQGFYDWLKGKIFKFNINLPDVPDWALPGSPLPIHTAWKNFAREMDNLSRPVLSAVAVSGGAGNAGTSITNHNYYLNATYRYQSEQSLASDVRVLEMLRK